MDAKSDDRWRHTRGTWDRLRWARMAKGFERAQDFADSIAMKAGTYRAYEREPGENSKATPLDHGHAVEWGKKLKVRWEWLLTGEGTPWEATFYSMDLTPGKAKLRKLTDGLDDDKASKLADAIEAMLKAG